MKHSYIFPLALTIVGSSSCGDDEERSYESGLDDESTVATLDDDDKEQICRRLDAHLDVKVSFDELARVACLPGAILLSSSSDDCKARLDSCVASAPAPVRIRAQAMDERACFDSLAECNASVGTLETCVNVSVDAVLDFLERVTCSRYDDEEVRGAARSMETARGCAELNASCEDFGLLI